MGKRRKPDIVIPSSYGEIFKVFLNKDVFIDKRLYECYSKKKMLLAAILNGSFTFFFAEIASRTGLGEGLLDLTVYEVADWLIVNPLNFSESKAIEIESAFRSIFSQNIQTIDKETKDQNRTLLDQLILHTIGLDIRGIEEVHFELNRMVSNRLNRAVTF